MVEQRRDKEREVMELDMQNQSRKINAGSVKGSWIKI